MTSPLIKVYSNSAFAAPSASTGTNIGGGGIGFDEGGSGSSGNTGIYGIAVIPAPGASSVVPPLTSGLASFPASTAKSAVSHSTSSVAVSHASGANLFAQPLPLTAVPPLTNCSLVRWVFLEYS